MSGEETNAQHTSHTGLNATYDFTSTRFYNGVIKKSQLTINFYEIQSSSKLLSYNTLSPY